VPSAWSAPSNRPTNDHADGATLGRRGRPRRPVPIHEFILRARRPHHNGASIRSREPHPMPNRLPTSWTLRPGGVPGPALCRHSDPAHLPIRTMPYLAPSGRASRSVLPATTEAAGVPSAWSAPSNRPTNDHADGATLGRWDANASQRPRRPVPIHEFILRARRPHHNGASIRSRELPHLGKNPLILCRTSERMNECSFI